MANVNTNKRAWFYDLFFVFVLLIAAYLRLSGSNWGEGYHQHPDELFLSGVLGSLNAQSCQLEQTPAAQCPDDERRWLTPGEYFDTANSPLNPYNQGYGFFVYGNLPLTLVRVIADAGRVVDAGALKFLARQMSAVADLLTIAVLYLLVTRLYGRRVALLSATFSALTVMQIQQSHFFTTDLFTNLFMFLAISFAVAIIKQPWKSSAGIKVLSHPLLWLSVGFGLMLGMAMASKINAAALALMLPGALILQIIRHNQDIKALKGRENEDARPVAFDSEYWAQVFIFLVAGGFATLLSFRVFQPYAFDGLNLNPHWISNIMEQRAQAAGSDLPWNLQWARRTHWYSFSNLTTWGFGLPLGILAWCGFLWMGWRIIKGELQHLLLWGWTAFYFTWQSLQFNPTMRYQLPVYPLLAMMAAWLLTEIFQHSAKKEAWDQKFKLASRSLQVASVLIGVVVTTLTAMWAFAFLNIYLQPEPRMAASRWIFQNAPGPVNLRIQTGTDEIYNQPLPIPGGTLISPGIPNSLTFTARKSGKLTGVRFGHALDFSNPPAAVLVRLYTPLTPDTPLAQASAEVDASAIMDPRGPSVDFLFEKAIDIFEGQSYSLQIETLGTGLTISGSGIANETDYDWSLPFRVDGYDAFGGIYSGDLNLQVYWDDNFDKFNRFNQILGGSDYIVIPTNHQYAQITRLPERYPLTTHYYRELLGCPQDMDIIECYRTAQPGKYQGRLGFELVKVFESYPTLGAWVINDQAAEEAFTFYDHPKVLIFKKSADFNPENVSRSLGTVNLTNVVHLLPAEADNYKDLLLPAERLVSQRNGGTWSELFDYEWLQNKYPALGVVFWYGFIFLLGLAAYPIARTVLPGFRQYAYPLSRIIGLLLLAWLSWIGGSLGVSYTRGSIGIAFGLIVILASGLWFTRKIEFKAEWNANRKFFTLVEVIFLIFFLIDLLIRLGNSDMWHPSKGGERPMDFSYFNAVIKSSSFPPYDPWFAGGYINYYYFGFVLAGTPVKLLGIVPSLAYNFILPTWFALIAIGAFAVGWNLLVAQPDSQDGLDATALSTGLTASSLMILLGNLGTVQMISQALQRIAAPGGVIPADISLTQKISWFFQGVGLLFQGNSLLIGRGEWYWNPSRVIPAGPGNEITEFPLFTLLYSDLHAHMLVMPLTLLIIAWAISFIKSRASMKPVEWVATLLVGSLAIGAIKPTNTWDFYTFFPVAALAVLYAVNRHFDWKSAFNIPDWAGRVSVSIIFIAGLYLLGSLMFAPFDAWYGQAYNKVDPWSASRTPLSSYFTHWGVFLFIIVFWLIWEVREWMADTPVSHLEKLYPYRVGIEVGLAAVLAASAFFIIEKVSVALIALPLAVIAGMLLLRGNLPGVKRAVLLLIGTGFFLTLVVEVMALRGDIGRMNTIFKLYMQAWMLFAISAAAAFGWLLEAFPFWRLRWRTFFQTGLSLLLAGSLIFTITATTDKISDRINPEAPRTLDGMTFMNYAQHFDGQMMDLSQDYRAIRWMQENVKGSPVIVEANCSEYRWCTRFTIYTGLPGVVGWNWHQRQQRALVANNSVYDRVAEVGTFYSTQDIGLALSFLEKYQVKYIVVGQLERNIYPPEVVGLDGFAKFDSYEGTYWKAVYHEANTTIYEVLP